MLIQKKNIRSRSWNENHSCSWLKLTFKSHFLTILSTWPHYGTTVRKASSKFRKFTAPKKEPNALSTALRFGLLRNGNKYIDFIIARALSKRKKICSTYVVHMYIKRLFIQKCICTTHLALKLCLMNCFIKKMTRYQFD